MDFNYTIQANCNYNYQINFHSSNQSLDERHMMSLQQWLTSTTDEEQSQQRAVAPASTSKRIVLFTDDNNNIDNNNGIVSGENNCYMDNRDRAQQSTSTSTKQSIVLLGKEFLTDNNNNINNNNYKVVIGDSNCDHISRTMDVVVWSAKNWHSFLNQMRRLELDEDVKTVAIATLLNFVEDEVYKNGANLKLFLLTYVQEIKSIATIRSDVTFTVLAPFLRTNIPQHQKDLPVIISFLQRRFQALHYPNISFDASFKCHKREVTRKHLKPRSQHRLYKHIKKAIFN